MKFGDGDVVWPILIEEGVGLKSLEKGKHYSFSSRPLGTMTGGTSMAIVDAPPSEDALSKAMSAVLFAVLDLRLGGGRGGPRGKRDSHPCISEAHCLQNHSPFSLDPPYMYILVYTLKACM